MEDKIALLSDIIVLVFDLVIYAKLTKLKKDNLVYRTIMHIGCVSLFVFYILGTQVFHLAASVASFVCITVPSFTLFWILSAYKDARFFVTFCFVDTVTLVIAFFARAAGVFAGPLGGIISCIFAFLLFLIIYLKCRPYFSRYRVLLESVQDGWGVLMISTILIYALMVFASAYPKPLVERMEYVPVYVLISLTVISFYVVFIVTLFQKKRLYDLNIQLQNEKKWHKIAYQDTLTGMKNRTAYLEKINELERALDKENTVYAMVIDLDNFKKINDTLGHHVGDITLKKAADFLKNIFCGDDYEIFRIGGDEFAVIALNVPKEILEQKIDFMNSSDNNSEIGCTFSSGYAVVNLEQNNAMENAFIRADRAMYDEKSRKKSLTHV